MEGESPLVLSEPQEEDTMIRSLRTTAMAVALAALVAIPASAGGPSRDVPIPTPEIDRLVSGVDALPAPTDSQTAAAAQDLPAVTDTCPLTESLATPLNPAVPLQMADAPPPRGPCHGNVTGDCPTLRDKECWPICGRNQGYCILILNCETQCVCQ
jgi:hypothetical protein